MDDLKRTIYMRALDLVNKPEKPYVCVALTTAFEEIIGYQPSCEELQEYLPEFHDLIDYKTWVKFENCDTISARSWDNYVNFRGWWTHFWQEPRIRILNCILNTY